MTVLKMKSKKYHTVGIVPKSNRKIVERGKIDTPDTQKHDHVENEKQKIPHCRNSSKI